MSFSRLRLILFLLILLPVSGFANDLKFERDRARDVMEVISSDIEKNFYDSNLKGLDWKSLVADTDRKIEAAQSVSAMYTAIFGLINKLDDSHTALLPPGRAVEIKFGFNAKPFGEKVLVYELTKKGPAEIAGLQLGDELLLMNGFKVNRQSYQKIVYYLRMIRPANELEIVYRRGNGELQKLRWETQVENKPLMVDVTEFANMWKYIRESENRDQEYRPQWRKFDEVGYIKLKEFIENERDQGENLLRRLDNPKALVVDLRGNGGGAQNGLLDFSGFLEPAPVTMCEVSGRRRTEQLKIKPYSPQFPIPMVILIDSESASASEMFARHFQREKRAVVVGDTSEGAVNEALFFDHKLGADIVVFYGIEVAVGKVVFPDGEVLEKKGVTPDQMCLPTTSDLQDGKDPCLDKAVLLAHDLAKNGVDGKVTTSGK